MTREGSLKSWATRRREAAERVRDLMRDFYAADNKRSARKHIIRWLASRGVTRPIDFYAGGWSADDMVAAGMAPISCEDGSQKAWAELGLSKKSIRAAVELLATEAPYRLEYGDALRWFREADGGYLDYCGQYCKSIEAGLRAADAAGWPAVVVTVAVPERTAVGTVSREQRIGMIEWALKDAAGGLRMAMHFCYRRRGGEEALVYGFDRRSAGFSTIRTRLRANHARRGRPRVPRALPPEMRRRAYPLTDDLVRTLRRQYGDGAFVMDLAREHGLPHGKIYPVVLHRTFVDPDYAVPSEAQRARGQLRKARCINCGKLFYRRDPRNTSCTKSCRDRRVQREARRRKRLVGAGREPRRTPGPGR